MSEVVIQSDVDSGDNHNVTWRFGLLWTAANLACFGLLTLPVGDNFVNVLIGSLFLPLLGLVQWLILRQVIQVKAWWILATIVGGGIWIVGQGAAVIGMALGGGSFESLVPLLFTPVVFNFWFWPSFAVGILQWWVLHQRVTNAGLWILYSTVGLVLGFILSEGFFIKPWIWIHGLIYSGLTGLALVVHLKYFGLKST